MIRLSYLLLIISLGEFLIRSRLTCIDVGANVDVNVDVDIAVIAEYGVVEMVVLLYVLLESRGACALTRASFWALFRDSFLTIRLAIRFAVV